MATLTLFNQSITLANADNPGADLTLTTEFSVSSDVTLTGIWYYSPTGASGLSDSCAIFDVATTTIVSGTDNTSPSWSGVAASGWVKCAYDGTITLTGGNSYLVAIHLSSSVSDGYGKTVDFWTTGTGQDGVTNGVLSAPNYTTSTLQGAAQSGGGGTLSYPTVMEGGAYYGVDVEVDDGNGGGNNTAVVAWLTV